MIRAQVVDTIDKSVGFGSVSVEKADVVDFAVGTADVEELNNLAGIR